LSRRRRSHLLRRNRYAIRDAEREFPRAVQARKKTGRPPVETPRIHNGFRLAADVVKGIRATGKGYNARAGKVLREALAKGEL
jgi:uncharacterized protein (DUF4415 family)